MGTNTAAPNGLSVVRNRFSGSPTFQASTKLIKKSYATSIGIGDLVITQSGASQGYIGVSAGNEIAQLGVFLGIAGSGAASNVQGAVGGGYYDQSIQQYVYGLNGSYQSSANPIGDIACMVADDPGLTFVAQMIGGAWAQSLAGQNINFTAGTNGAPNAAGRSILSLDYASIAVGNQLPFRIIGLSGVAGGPQDPTNTNPWIEVALNTAEMLQGAGI